MILDYDISFFGIQRYLHSFDSEKYGKIPLYLAKKFGITSDQYYKPEMVSDDNLLKVHTHEYLDSLNNSETIASITEVGALYYMPNFLLHWKLLNPMKYATGGTIKGVELAQEYGWAINL